ncbi:MAG: hypothetical protein QXQ75_02235 [Candidatus Nitrosocaldaceae archaeon]
MMSVQPDVIKDALFKLLKENKEFRYIMSGLLGLEEIKSSIAELTDSINKLVSLQCKMEERIVAMDERLINRIVSLETRVARIEESLMALRHEVGRLSNTVEFTLEDIAVTKLPWLLRKDGIIIKRSDIKVRYIIKINDKERGGYIC